MQRMAKCEDLFCDAIYLENHDMLKTNFENFSKSFGKPKSEIFNYTGGILKNKYGYIINLFLIRIEKQILTGFVT